MTDSGNKPPKLLNDLGGHEYPADVQQLIHTLAMSLKARSEPFNDLSVMLAPGGPRPRDYIFLWTKTAGFIYELARNLEAYPVAPKVPQLSLLEWLTIITDIRFASGKKESPPRPIISDEERDALTAGLPTTGFDLDRISRAIEEGSVDQDGTLRVNLGNIQVKQPVDSIDVTISVDSVAKAISDGIIEPPPKPVDSIDPEKAKAILIRICEEFPGLLSEEYVSGGDLTQELMILLRSAL